MGDPCFTLAAGSEERAVVELPTGTVTFLFTDLEGSTRLWEENPEAMPTALARHDGISRDAVESHGGRVVKMTGDGVHAAFPTARAAVEAAIGGQLALSSQEWAETEPCGFHGRAYGGRAASRRGLFRAESEPGGSADRHGPWRPGGAVASERGACAI